jgi:tetratricopeptide (TPR) repeat protein
MWKKRVFKITGISLALLCFMLCSGTLEAQTKAEKKDLADEYLKRENYGKALEYYEDLSGDPEWDNQIFKSYIKCVEKIKPSKSEGIIKKYQKRYPNETQFQTFYFTYLRDIRKDEKEANRYAGSKLIPWFLKTSDRSHFGVAFFEEQKSPDNAKTLLESAVRSFGLASFWKEQMRNLLAEKDHVGTSKLVLELLQNLVVGEEELETQLQNGFSVEGLSKQLQMDLLKEIQRQPGNLVYPSFLAWIYLQSKDFEGALTQYKALDKLQNTGGTRCFQLGEFALNNELPRVAIQSFEFVIQNFPVSQYRFLAQQKLVQLREETVKNSFPVQPSDVRDLIREYNLLAQSQYLNVFDLTMKVAELYGKYLNFPDSAIGILETGMKTKRWPPAIQNKAKILLGDLYILKDEPWEASLLYGQVEKDEAESLTGYEAKLKNAKVFYFKGEFELCQEMLDVLKQSTSRDISNDAIELGLLLQDILAEDTTGYFLSKFADIDLLTFQGNHPAAIDQIEKLLITVSNAVVVEKLKFRLFRNFQAIRQFDKALIQLEEIYSAKASDLYLDDALFYRGILYAEHKKDKEKAIQSFLTLIKDIPGSVYVAEARKRLRILRNDAVN